MRCCKWMFVLCLMATENIADCSEPPIDTDALSTGHQQTLTRPKRRPRVDFVLTFPGKTSPVIRKMEFIDMKNDESQESRVGRIVRKQLMKEYETSQRNKLKKKLRKSSMKKNKMRRNKVKYPFMQDYHKSILENLQILMRDSHSTNEKMQKVGSEIDGTASRTNPVNENIVQSYSRVEDIAAPQFEYKNTQDLESDLEASQLIERRLKDFDAGGGITQDVRYKSELEPSDETTNEDETSRFQYAEHSNQLSRQKRDQRRVRGNDLKRTTGSNQKLRNLTKQKRTNLSPHTHKTVINKQDVRKINESKPSTNSMHRKSKLKMRNGKSKHSLAFESQRRDKKRKREIPKGRHRHKDDVYENTTNSGLVRYSNVHEQLESLMKLYALYNEKVKQNQGKVKTSQTNVISKNDRSGVGSLEGETSNDNFSISLNDSNNESDLGGDRYYDYSGEVNRNMINLYNKFTKFIPKI